MSNLIPPHSRTTVTHEYLARVVSVSAVLLGILFCIFAVLLVPAYVTVSSRLHELEATVTEKSDTENEFLTVKTAITEANDFVAELNALPEHYGVTPVLTQIMNTPHNGISFISFQFPDTKSKPTGKATSTPPTIFIRGEAASRIALASFKQALEATPAIMTATVPLSDLARDSELPFAITATLDITQLQTP